MSSYYDFAGYAPEKPNPILTREQASNWIKNFRDNKGTYSLRLGQAFCNEFNISNPELFYCEYELDAADMIFDKYTQQ